MATGIWKLRLALLLSFLKGSLWSLLLKVCAGVIIVIAVVAIGLLPLIADLERTSYIALDTSLVTIVGLASCCIAFFFSHRMLSVRNFSGFPMSTRSLAFSLFASSLFTWPVLLFVLWSVVIALTREPGSASIISGVFSVVLTTVTFVLAVRVFVELGIFTSSQLNLSLVKSIGYLLFVAGIPVLGLFVFQVFQENGYQLLQDASQPMSWTPFGAAIAGHSEALRGETGLSLLKFGLSVFYALMLYVLWLVTLKASLSSSVRAPRNRFDRASLGLFVRFPSNAWGVVAAKSLIYWLRDPRYRTSLLVIPIAPILVTCVLWIAGVDQSIIVLVPIPLLLVLLGWSIHNDVSADSTALWLHVSSSTPGISDRIGRLAPAVIVGIPIMLIGSSLSVVLLGDWRVLPVVLGLNVATLCLSLGISSLSSALMPYPFTRPGDSPFSQPANSNEGFSSGLAQSLSMVAIGVLISPLVFFANSALLLPTFGNNLSYLVASVFYGVLVLCAGVWYGGKVFDRSAPELLTLSQSFD